MRTLVLVLGLLLAMPAIAAPSDITITADTFVIDEVNHMATFTGKVNVSHPFLKLLADQVVVTYGDKGTSDILSFVATGLVQIDNETQTATGNQAIYDPSTQILRLTGNVMVKNGPTILAGPELIVDLASNTSTFSGGGTPGRVTGIFTQP